MESVNGAQHAQSQAVQAYGIKGKSADLNTANSQGQQTSSITDAGTVSLSHEGSLISHASATVQSSLHSHSDRIDALRQQVASGQYHVDVHALANAMLKQVS